MIRTNRKVITVDGKDYLVIKLAQSHGSMDRLLVIGPDGENKIIDVKHMDYLSAKPRPVTIAIEGSK